MILYSILITVILFFVGLLLRTIIKDLCVLCFSIAGTWIVFVTADFVWQVSVNHLILGIYMGGSVIGLMYFLSSKLPEKFFIFKFPFILSLIFLIFSFLELNLDKTTLLVVALLWIVFLPIFFFRNFPGLKDFTRKIIECCKNW